MKANFSFFAFWLPSARYGPAVESRGAHAGAPQTHPLDHSKSARGDKPKGMQKSGKKFAFISFFFLLLDNIQLKCVIKNFAKFINLVKITEFMVILGGLRTTQGACGLSSLINSHERRTHHA